MSGPTPADRQAQAGLASRLAAVGFVLPGTLFERYTTCGKANCRCAAEPPVLHGPYFQWTRTAQGKPVVRRLSADLADRYWAWFDNARTHREVLAQLEDLSIEIVDRDRRAGPPRGTVSCPQQSGAEMIDTAAGARSTKTPQEAIWTVLEDALRWRRGVEVSYHGRTRVICPHALGWRGPRAMVLGYQVGGQTSTGMLDPDPTKRWRCLFIDEIDTASLQMSATWESAGNYDPLRPFNATGVRVATAV